MRTSAASFLLGFMVAVWLTPVARRLAYRFQLVDRPQDGRRVNKKSIPRAGGLAIAAGVLAPILALAFYENTISRAIYADLVSVAALFVGALAALGIGLVDDLYRPSAKLRLLALVAVAALCWLGGHRVEDIVIPGVGQVTMGFWSLPVTVLWIVGVIVAFNFVDGLDGLATGIALISTVTLFVCATIDNNVLLMTWTGAMAGALLGFLIFNFNPASIFMGDAGSNFLGFVLALVALQTSRKTAAAVSFVVPFCVLGLPLLDVSLTMVRRALLRQGLFTSERGHLHHRLLQLGLSHRWAVLVLYGVTTVFCLGAVAIAVPLWHLHLLVATVITAVVFGLMFATGYVHPRDLLQMYRQGKANAARQQHVESVCQELAQSFGAEGDAAAASPRVLQTLVDRGCVTAAHYRCERGCRTVAGEYDQLAKGIRLVVQDGRSAASNMFVFWKERCDDPTPRESAALHKLFASIECSCKLPSSRSDRADRADRADRPERESDRAQNASRRRRSAVDAHEKIWAAIVESAHRLALSRVHLELATSPHSEGFNATWGEMPRDGEAMVWRIDLPVKTEDGVVGWLRVAGDSMRYSNSRDVARLLDVLDSSQSYLQSIRQEQQEQCRETDQSRETDRTWREQGVADSADLGVPS
jgi:UDP-GlcNAc:undecaprenyl-phosphate/decaprenyl-phosphate GlcNAc-1-phosphate transferase